MGKRARGGTRTAFQPLQTQGSRGNMRNPARSVPHTTQSEARNVDNVHTPFLPYSRPTTELPRSPTRALWCAKGNLRTRLPWSRPGPGAVSQPGTGNYSPKPGTQEVRQSAGALSERRAWSRSYFPNRPGPGCTWFRYGDSVSFAGAGEMWGGGTSREGVRGRSPFACGSPWFNRANTTADPHPAQTRMNCTATVQRRYGPGSKSHCH
ncbi:hypothetical protein ACVWY0_004395 [Arthrobacter sp. UYNi723]